MARTEQSSSTKRHKVSNSVDRLSSLPDSILCHILSFLPTKLSVATSILAKSWRFLWTHVPVLDLDNDDDFEVKSDDGPFFSDILNRILALHNAQDLNTFRLLYTLEFDTWIAAAVTRKVRTIEIRLFQFPEIYPLPWSLFTCKTLVELTLEHCDIHIDMSSDLCFPCLKTLCLCSVGYNNNETLPHLLSCCPVLTGLEIDKILSYDFSYCCISSPTIKWLVILFEFVKNVYDTPFGMEIDAPSLETLTMTDSVSNRISAQMLASLITADISLTVPKRIEDDNLYSSSVFKFLDRLCKVERLTLSIEYDKFVESAFSVSTVKFHNLTELDLAADWLFLTKFLENADNLQVLNIRMVDKAPNCWMEPLHVAKCLLSHLRTIRIDEFKFADNEFEMVSYLLRNALVLKKMEIYSRAYVYDYKEKFCALKRISQFERGSTACKLDFD